MSTLKEKKTAAKRVTGAARLRAGPRSLLEAVLQQHEDLDLSDPQLVTLARIYWDKSARIDAFKAVSAVASVLSHDQFLKAVALSEESRPSNSDRTEATFDNLVADALEQKVKDRELVEVEVASAVTERIVGWAKVFGFFLALPCAALVAILALFGVSKFEDVQKAADKVDAKIAAAQSSLDTATLRASQFVTKTEEQLAALQGDFSRQNEQISSLNKKVSQIAEILTFSGANDLSGDTKERISNLAERFLTYFQKLGYGSEI